MASKVAPRARPFSDFLDRLHVFKDRRLFAVPLVLGNLVAVYYGWTDYYAYQFSVTPVWLWPLVSDSPNAVLLFATAVFLHLIGRGNRIVDLVAFIANVKVGLWTVFVLLYYYPQFFDEDVALRWLLFWLHVGMMGQAFVLYRDLRREPLALLWGFAVITAFFLHDGIDYSLGIHPILPRTPNAFVVSVTVLITALASASAWFLFVRRKNKAATP